MCDVDEKGLGEKGREWGMRWGGVVRVPCFLLVVGFSVGAFARL